MKWDVHSILDDVALSTTSLIYEESFYGHFFVGLLKEVHEGIQTMAIGPAGHHVKLHINPIFWKEQLTSSKLKMGLVKHEILHVVFKHIFRGKDYGNHDLFNIACDLVVNQYIKQDWLPENRIHLGLFPGIGMEPDRDADDYYHRLLRLMEKMEGKGIGDSGQLMVEGTGEGMDKGGGVGGDSGASGDSRASGHDGMKDSGGSLEEKAWENLRNILETGKEWQAKHALWVDLEKLPAAIREILEGQIDQALQEALDRSRRDAREWGKLPAGLRRHLEALEAKRKPVVNWRRLLRIFAESSSRTYVRNTLKRASRRYGTTPGIRIRKRQKLLVAVDTSGSIRDEELRDFFAEVYHIWKQGAEVTVVECDLQIAARYTYKGAAPAEVHGRGGTSFEPPLKLANEELLPDAVIYFTDAVAPAVETVPRMPVLWLICGDGAEPGSKYYEQLRGTKIKMPKGNS
ncbi:MAG: VWA-like domain-containing protein [Bacteroidia bacterium]